MRSEVLIRYYVISIIVLVVDQIVKRLVVVNMKLDQEIPLIPEFIQLTSIRNRGAAFGILQNQRVLFILITVVVLALILIYLKKVYRGNVVLSSGLAFIMGGALGNFVDRARKGEVVDMLEFTFINFLVFNVADVFISLGVGLVIIDTLLKAKRGNRKISSAP
ncbi:signal peptidase II [Paenibacillus agaridevorans]|uniref:signal peptidase II n=1 Tax=Paenibacillus agaridevorans TaxID=171404 RepID=UPI001FE34B69|nr:signal peptidase II [Paenibacillus agaridevorans]